MNPPKRPTTAYFLFASEQKCHVIKNNLQISSIDLAKEIGERWKNLSEEQKKPYVDRASVLKKQYEDDLLRYNTLNKPHLFV